MNQADIFSQLRRAELDIALTYDLDIPADLDFQPLHELPPYVVLGEGHPLANHTELTIEDLQNSPMVLLDLPFSGEYFLSFFRDANIKPNIAERTADMSVMRSLVANGFGFSIANIRPLNVLSPDGKKLIFVPLAGELRPMRLGLLRAVLRMRPTLQKRLSSTALRPFAPGRYRVSARAGKSDHGVLEIS